MDFKFTIHIKVIDVNIKNNKYRSVFYDFL